MCQKQDIFIFIIRAGMRTVATVISGIIKDERKCGYGLMVKACLASEAFVCMHNSIVEVVRVG